eukprot:Gb_21521 [translate_table: standard]
MSIFAGQPDNAKINGHGEELYIQDSSQRALPINGSSCCNGDHPTLLSHEFASTLVDKPLCLVLGSEGKGLSKKSKELCNLIAIPMPGEIESLNVSVAGGIFLFLLRRQHMVK